MLDYEDEILLEQYITYNYMNSDTRDLCMNLILHMKEINDSDVSLNENANREYRINTMRFGKYGMGIKFNGIISNENESRLIDGVIVRKENNYFVKANLYRLDEYLDDEDRDYSIIEHFIIMNDHIKRKSYSSVTGIYCVDKLPLFDETYLYDYYKSMIDRGFQRIQC